MDITLLVFITLISLFFVAVGYMNKSWLMATFGGVVLLIVAAIILLSGIDTIQGKSQTQVFNLTTSNDQLIGNLTSTNQITYTNNKNNYTNGLGIGLTLLSLFLIYSIFKDTNGGGG